MSKSLKDVNSKQKPYFLGAIYLNVTDRCNLKCRHCWLSPHSIPAAKQEVGKREGYTEGLSVSVMRDVINQARPLGLHTIKLTGGEPFLRSDIMDFVSLFHEQELTVDIETNGTLIDESIARKLKQYKVRTISVSLDGAEHETHDRFRGVDGAFAMATRGIDHLRQQNLNTQVIISLHRGNVEEIENIAFFAADLGVQSLKINPIMPIGRGYKMRQEDLTLSVEELIEFSQNIREHLQPKIGIPIYYYLPIAFEPFTYVVQGTHPKCPVLNILGIVENGDISFCGIENVEKDLVMGNVNSDRLDTIWMNHPLLKTMRESVPWQLEGICGRCFFKKICLGTCRACAYHLEKSLTAPYWFCQEAFEKGLFPETRYLT
jgi:SynChlorMet cassette radical SAM/SPASM protein ScmF